MYADDTNIFLKHKSYENLYLEANQQLSDIEKWLNCNKLTPNIKKTFYIVFRRLNNVPLQIHLHSHLRIIASFVNLRQIF